MAGVGCPERRLGGVRDVVCEVCAYIVSVYMYSIYIYIHVTRADVCVCVCVCEGGWRSVV